MLAYALTVHRAQGLTSKSVIFHLQQLFAHGQLYTGLSRSRVSAFECMRVTGPLDQGMACCAPEVQRFELDTDWIYIRNGPDDPKAAACLA